MTDFNITVLTRNARHVEYVFVGVESTRFEAAGTFWICCTDNWIANSVHKMLTVIEAIVTTVSRVGSTVKTFTLNSP